MPRNHLWLSFALGAALLACDGNATQSVAPEGNAPDPESPEPPESDFSVVVRVSHWPPNAPDYDYSWTVGNAARVRVSQSSDPTVVAWEIVDGSGSGIRPPVRHGLVPVEAVLVTGVGVTLMLGVEYRVSVELLRDGREASTVFTR
jgi:hypothetical protein